MVKYRIIDLYSTDFGKAVDVEPQKDESAGLTLANKKKDVVVNVPEKVKPVKILEKQGLLGKDDIVLTYFLTPTGFFDFEEQKTKKKLTFEAKEYVHSTEFIKRAWTGGLFRAFFHEFAMEDKKDLGSIIKWVLIIGVLGFIAYYAATNLDIGGVLGGIGI